MKMIDLSKHPDARNTVRKETTIHRMLSNPFIIQYFGQRSETNMEYIFLEYASGGELFDRIGKPIFCIRYVLMNNVYAPEPISYLAQYAYIKSHEWNQIQQLKE